MFGVVQGEGFEDDFASCVVSVVLIGVKLGHGWMGTFSSSCECRSLLDGI